MKKYILPAITLISLTFAVYTASASYCPDYKELLKDYNELAESYQMMISKTSTLEKEIKGKDSTMLEYYTQWIRADLVIDRLQPKADRFDEHYSLAKRYGEIRLIYENGSVSIYIP